MSDTHDVHQLVIRNLGVLEQAPAIVEEAEKRIFEAIDKRIKDWIQAQENWAVFGCLSSDIWFKPLAWPVRAEEEWPTCFSIGTLTSEGFRYTLSAIVGAVNETFGIHFLIDASWITGLEGQKNARAGKKWEDFLRNRITDFPAFAQNGFHPEGQTLFHPVQLNATALADAYPNTLADALEPVDEALAHLAAALPEFNRLIEAAQSHFTPQAADAPQPG